MSTPTRRIIPREDLGNADWQPLVFTSINDPRPPRMRRPDPVPTPAEAEEAARVAAQPAAVAEPETVPEPMAQAEPEAPVAPSPLDTTAEDLEALRQQAQQEGFEAGHAEGLAAGRAEAEADTQRLRQMLGQLGHFTEEAGADLAENVLDLALTVARELARAEIAADKQRLVPVIREMIETMPIMKPPARILANPEDVESLQAMLGAELPEDTWRLVADPNIEPGGCKIETATSRADLTLATRWAQQLRVLRRADKEELTWQAEVPEPAPAPIPAPAAAAAPAPAAAPEPAPVAAPAVAPASTPNPAEELLAQFDPHTLDIAQTPAQPATAAAPPVQPVTPVAPVEDVGPIAPLDEHG